MNAPPTSTPNSYRAQPDERGHFGEFGGRYVAETLMPLVLELDQAYRAAKNDPASNIMSAALARYIMPSG
jgi:tryptophan synthase beta chain